MKKATFAQRFAAYVIDIIIVLIIFSVFSHIVEAIIKLPTLTDDLINLMSDRLKESYNKGGYTFLLDVYTSEDLTSDYNEWMALTDVKAFYDEYNKSYFTILGIDVIFLFIEWIIYFIIFPLHFKFQTVGRLFFKVRLISLNDETLSYGQLFKREILAVLFILIFNYFFFITLILDIVYIRSRNMSINDMFAHTMLVRIDKKETHE